MNTTQLVGRLVKDPELKYTSNGKSIAAFTIAVDKRFKPQDGGATADFFRCKAWGQPGEFLCNYGGKGRMVGVTGRIETGEYTDKEGIKRNTFDIVCDTVELLDSAKGGDGQ